MQIIGCAALLAALLLVYWGVEALGWSGLLLLVIALQMLAAVLNLLFPSRHG